MFEYTINQSANQQAQSRLSKAYRCELVDRVPVVEMAREDPVGQVVAANLRYLRQRRRWTLKQTAEKLAGLKPVLLGQMGDRATVTGSILVYDLLPKPPPR